MYRYIKAKWIATNSGGGNSIIGFKEVREEFIERPDGGTDWVHDDKPQVVTIMPERSNPAEDAKPLIKGDQTFILRKGEFLVQDIPDNKATLRMMVRKNWIRLADWELQAEMSEKVLVPEVSEKVLEDTTVRVDITPDDAKAKKDQLKKERAAKLKEKLNKQQA